jgi:hypothetical protein
LAIAGPKRPILHPSNGDTGLCAMERKFVPGRELSVYVYQWFLKMELADLCPS